MHDEHIHTHCQVLTLEMPTFNYWHAGSPTSHTLSVQQHDFYDGF